MVSMFRKIQKTLKNAKNSKYFAVVIAIVLIVVLLGVYCLVNIREKEDIVEAPLKDATITEVMESRLANILEDIAGVDNVSVMISYASTSEIVYESVSSDALFEEDKLVEIKEEIPAVLGVVVVADGVDVVKTKLSVVNAVMTVLAIGADKIQVFAK